MRGQGRNQLDGDSRENRKDTMKTQKLVWLAGIILLSVAVSAAILALVYALQNPHVVLMLASIGWNGMLAT